MRCIDRRFIDGLSVGSRQAALIRAIVTMSEELGIVPIAEGVERPEQADMLLGLGCNWGQGHHLVRPATPDDPALLMAIDGAEHLPRNGGPPEDPRRDPTGARSATGISSRRMSSWRPCRSTACPPAAVRFRTQLVFAPSMETRYRSPR